MDKFLHGLPEEEIGDPGRSAAVAVRVRRDRRVDVGGEIANLLCLNRKRRLFQRGLDLRGIRTDETGDTRPHAFRAFGRFAQDEYRLAKTRRLLLQTAGVGKYEIALSEQPEQTIVRSGGR